MGTYSRTRRPAAGRGVLLGLFLCCTTAVLAGHAWAVDASDFSDLEGAAQVEEDVILSGAPSETAIQEAADLGIRTIVDFRQPEEGTLSEQALVERLGMTYVNIPVELDRIGPLQADLLNDILSQPVNRPALVHCVRGRRAAAVWAYYLKDHREMSIDDAVDTASSTGLMPPDRAAKIRARMSH